MRYLLLTVLATVLVFGGCSDVPASSDGGATDSDTDADTDSDTDTDTGSDTDTGTGPCIEWEGDPYEDAVTCEAATTVAACAAASAAIHPGPTDDFWQQCVWVRFVEVLPGPPNTCAFGEERFRCVYRAGGEEGCVGSSPTCGVGEQSPFDDWHTVNYFCDDGQLFMTVLSCGTNSCSFGECLWDHEGEGILTDGIDECECVCDPGFSEE